MRLRDKYKLSRQCTGDNVLVLYGDPKKGTADINVRVISVILDGGETEYLATSVFDSLLTAEDFRELYFMRWPIEQHVGDRHLFFRKHMFCFAARVFARTGKTTSTDRIHLAAYRGGSLLRKHDKTEGAPSRSFPSCFPVSYTARAV